MKEKGYIGRLLGWIWRHPQPLVVLVTLVSVVVVISIFWGIPTWQTISRTLTGKDQAQLRIEFVKTWAEIALGALLLATLYLTWRRVTAAERTVEVTQEGQITERFTRAVEQLGSDKMEIRLGGIYALERIAKDSSKDHWQVMEVLTAYVRENDWWKRQSYEERESSYSNFLQFLTRPLIPTDIQAILNVLRNRNSGREKPGQRLDLTGVSLLGANLKRANLRGATLIDADLRPANLNEVNLQDSDLSSGIPEAGFMDMGRVTKLSDADLRHANLQNANLWYVELGGADLRWANFRCANLGDSSLTYAHLENSILRGVDFRDANLFNAKLQGADLREAKNLTQKQIDSAVIDENTKLPDYLKESQRP